MVSNFRNNLPSHNLGHKPTDDWMDLHSEACQMLTMKQEEFKNFRSNYYFFCVCVCMHIGTIEFTDIHLS